MQAWVMGLAGGLALPLRTGLQVDHEVNARSDVSAKERTAEATPPVLTLEVTRLCVSTPCHVVMGYYVQLLYYSAS